MAYPPYKPGFNVEAFQVTDRVDLFLKETAATRESVDFYQDIEYFGGMIFFFDNIAKKIYGWVSLYWKHRDWAKKVAKETEAKKFEKVVLSILQKEMEKDLSGYVVIRVNEGEQNDDFENLFLYEIVEFHLYKQHYYRSDVQMLMPVEDEAPAITECPKCQWVLSSDATKCPRCQTVVRKEEE